VKRTQTAWERYFWCKWKKGEDMRWFHRDNRSPYLKEGRLADVIAAVQVMSAAERPEKKIKDWVDKFEGNSESATIKKWTILFTEHREFFLTYYLKGDPDLKAALRWRYAFRTFDAANGIQYTPETAKALSKTERDLLTSKPLEGDQIETLVNTAIGLRGSAMEELAASRWWIPLVAACVPLIAAVLTLVGVILGAVLSALLAPHR